MKDLIALTAIAAFTVTSAVADKPPAFAADKATAAVRTKPMVVAARQLPFDREQPKN